MSNPYSQRSPIEIKKHHWMVAATLTIATTETDGQVNLTQMNMNGVIVTETDYVTALDLGRGNQLLQQMFRTRYKPDPEKTEIIDIFTISVCHLGHMKNSVFDNLPKPTTEVLEEAFEAGTPADDEDEATRV